MYDVIIVGAGPAGSTASRILANAGFDVLIIERNDSNRSPCAGYITRTINIEMPDPSIIQSRITRMRTYFPDMTYHDFALNSLVVDRPLFDEALMSEAIGSGAEIKWNSPLTDIEQSGNSDVMNVTFRGGSSEGRVIIGADGVFSKTSASLGLPRQRFAACAQYLIKNIEPLSNTCEIFFDADYAPGGYIWIYPSGNNSAKVGLGLVGEKISPHERLDSFLFESSVAERLGGSRSDFITGALPIGGLRESLVFDNVILAGDSAGMADPITGAGINNALLAGETAGRTIIKALENEDTAILKEYETKVRKLLGRPLARSLEKRKMMEACCNNQLLQEHLPEFWVTFQKK